MKINKIKYFLFNVMAVLIGAAVTSCSATFDEKKEPDPDPVEKPASRSILVYMIASNSLNGFDDNDIKEMQKVAKEKGFGDGRLVIYHQKYERSGLPVLKEIKSGSGTIDTLVKYDNQISSLSTDRMSKVISDFKEHAPADDYGIILWSHADGWIVRNSSSSESSGKSNGGISTLAFGQESISNTSRYMDITDLASVLKGKNFSFVYFDCCYMAGIEVLYEMKDVAPYMVASTIEVIAEGMPYHLTLPYFFSAGDADLIGAVNANYDYVNAKNDENRTGAFAVFDMSKINKLADATRSFYSYHPSAASDFSPQRFMYESTCYYFDFQHIIENLNLPEGTSETTLASFETARKDVLAALEDAVIYKISTDYIWPGYRGQEVKLDHFCGLSSYYLTDKSKSSTRGYNLTSWWNDVAKYLFE